MTVKNLADEFYENNHFYIYPTDMLNNFSKRPVVVMFGGKLHSLKTVTYQNGAMVLVASDSVWKPRKNEKKIIE